MALTINQETKDAAQAIQAAAALLGSITSRAKAESAQRNGKLGGRPKGAKDVRGSASSLNRMDAQRKRRAREAQEKAEASQDG